MKIKVDYTHPYLYTQLYNPVQQNCIRHNLEKEKQRRKVENSSIKSFAEHLKEANITR